MISRATEIAIAGLMAFCPTLALAGLEAQNYRYTCERGVEIPVVYVMSAEASVAVLSVEGGQFLLYSEAAATGARYGWPSDGSNYVWLTNGPDATLMWRDGTTKTETTLLAACKQN